MSWCCLPRRDYYYYNYRDDAADADDGASSFTSSRARVSLSFILKTNFEFSPKGQQISFEARELYNTK